MCTKPIKIVNRTKYLNNQYGQPYYYWVNCGHCEECRQMKQTEWNLRTYYQCLEAINNNKWIYFDTLTYSNENLPRLKDLMHLEIAEISWKKNYSCFNYKDIRNFLENIRLYYRKDKYKIQHFITAEYGELRNRPHYHIMLFVPNEIQPIEFSQVVSKCWGLGRTDGRPFKSKQYVMEHNVIKAINLDCIRYVAKYVNKSAKFMEIVNKRWNDLERNLNRKKTNELNRIKRKYYNLATPFHRQSQQYGMYAIKFFSIDELIKGEPIFYKDDSLKINIKCQLPMYYKRKLFQEQYQYLGKRLWRNNVQGVLFKNNTNNRIIEKVYNRLNDRNAEIGNKYTTTQLKNIANYIINERGRQQGKEDYLPHNEEADNFNYISEKDQIYLGKKCVSKNWAGNDKVGYCITAIEENNEEVEKRIYINPEYEEIINTLIMEKDTTSLSILKEHLNDIRKIYFGSIFSV